MEFGVDLDDDLCVTEAGMAKLRAQYEALGDEELAEAIAWLECRSGYIPTLEAEKDAAYQVQAAREKAMRASLARIDGEEVEARLRILGLA